MLEFEDGDVDVSWKTDRFGSNTITPALNLSGGKTSLHIVAHCNGWIGNWACFGRAAFCLLVRQATGQNAGQARAKSSSMFSCFRRTDKKRAEQGPSIHNCILSRSTATEQACWGCQYDAIGIDIHDLLLAHANPCYMLF